MPFFAEGKNGEYLNEAIINKLNSGNKLSSFIADPEFYANLIFSIYKNNNDAIQPEIKDSNDWN